MLTGIRIDRAFPLSILALIPDLDALFYIHRSLSHSILIPSVVAVPLLLLSHRSGSRNFLALALLAVASHSILDLFAGYTPILWPIYNYSIWLQVGLDAHISSSPSLSLSCRTLVKPISFQPFQSLDASLVTGEGLIVSVVLLAPLLLKAFRNELELRRVLKTWMKSF